MFDGPAPFRDLNDLMLDLTLSSVRKLAFGSVISTVSARGILSFGEGSAVGSNQLINVISTFIPKLLFFSQKLIFQAFLLGNNHVEPV